MRVAVVDDERPARSELKHQLTEIVPDIEVLEGDSGAAALEIASSQACDIFFLDINLGDINGTGLVKAISNMQPEAKIVFVTAYSEYAVKAFELEVTDYIMKPFDQRRLEKVLNRCRQEEVGAASMVNRQVEVQDGQPAGNLAEKKKLAVNSSGKTTFLDMDKIIYIETYNRGCMIHTVDGGYSDNRPIGEFERKLQGCGFYRSQKSYLIKLDKIKEMFLWKNNSFAVRMEGRETEILPVGREKIKMLRQLLGA